MATPPSSSFLRRRGAILAVLAVILAGVMALLLSLRVPPAQDQPDPPLTPPSLTAEPALPDRLPAGQPFTARLSVAGEPTPTLSVSEPGLDIQADGSIQWDSPPIGKQVIVFTATNAAGTAQLTWEVDVYGEPVKITKGPALTCTAGQDYNSTVVATGTPPFQWSLGKHPEGMAIDPEAGTLTMSGEALEAGETYTVEVIVDNGLGRDTRTYEIVCKEKPEKKKEQPKKKTVKVAKAMKQPPKPDQPVKKPSESQPTPTQQATDAEVARVKAEQARLQAEAKRLEEQQKAAAEEARKQAEAERQEKERQAKLAELKKQREAQQKALAEAKSQAEAEAREEAEQKRLAEEAKRLAEEKAMQEKLNAQLAAELEAKEKAAAEEQLREAARQAQLKKLAEQQAALDRQLERQKQRRLEDEKKRLAEEAKRLAEEQRREAERQAAEKARLEAVKAQQEALRKQEEERRLQEQQRLAQAAALQAKKQAEAERQREETERLAKEAKRQAEIEKQRKLQEQADAIKKAQELANEQARQENARKLQEQAAKAQQQERQKELVQQGKKVDLARYELHWSGSFDDFVQVAKANGIRLLFTRPRSMLPNSDGMQFEITGAGGSGLPGVRQVRGVTIQSLAASNFSSKYFQVANVPEDASWQAIDSQLQRKLRVGGDYRMLGFFPFEFLAVMEQTAMDYYARNTTNPGLPFEKGAGRIVISLNRRGSIEIESMANTR